MKSNVSDCLEVMARVYEDVTIQCSADVSDLRDLMTIRSRVESEGLSFLTITLPAFCKDFERGLAQGHIDSTLFSRWKRVKNGRLPAFLQGITSRVFDRETGRLLNENPPFGVTDHHSTYILAVRQICLLFKKVESPCTLQREQDAVSNFKKVEQQLSMFSLPEEELERFRRVSSLLWSGMLKSFDFNVLVPKHGPGATAERISGNQKYVHLNWPERLETFFPIIGFGYPIGVVDSMSEIENVTFIAEERELPVRVTLVPKTLKAPRVIAIEPVAMQYAQQALSVWLVERLETWKYSRGSVNFTDQGINQRIALLSSSSQLFSTIDLSDASDRVPLSLVMTMLESNPDFRDSVLACRSRSAKLPDGEIISPLYKFASMGSALCFPIEAMYFFTVMVIATLEADNLPATAESVFCAAQQLYVYGDDLVVPTTNADAILEKLQLYNCKPNAAKTFVTGKFRESCGLDAYDGYEVTPTYLRHFVPQNRGQVSELISAVSLSNAFYKKGFWRAASFLRKRIDSILGPMPYVGENSEGLGYHSYLGYRSASRWNDALHRLESRAFVVQTIRRPDVIDGYPALTKCLLGLETSLEPGEGASLEWSELRGSVTLKNRWVRS